MKYPKYSIVLRLMAFLIILQSCNKSNFLNTRPNSAIVVPSTLADFQKLLDNYGLTGNPYVFGSTNYFGEYSADEFYVAPSTWNAFSANYNQNIYIWAPEIYQGTANNIHDWNVPYAQVFYANVVLDNLPSVGLNNSNMAEYDQIKGTALFDRSSAFYNLATEFSPVFDSISMSTDLGIILKLTSDININPGRASVKATFDQILGDLKASAALLPEKIPFDAPNRPSRPSAYGLLARIYLSMRAYDKAGSYADSSLQLYDKLTDYNSLLNGENPFSIQADSTNAERIYQSTISDPEFAIAGWGYGYGMVDSTLYGLYSDNDLRKTIFFVPSGSSVVAGYSYSGTYWPFSGIATDELYLIRAECKIRRGELNAGISDLNSLLSKRYKAGTFTPFEVVDQTTALNELLTERRKELVFRGTRWSDLRRLNKEGYNIVLKRSLDNVNYNLQPNSPFYVFPIPPDEISISKIQQNLR